MLTPKSLGLDAFRDDLAADARAEAKASEGIVRPSTPSEEILKDLAQGAAISPVLQEERIDPTDRAAQQAAAIEQISQRAIVDEAGEVRPRTQEEILAEQQRLAALQATTIDEIAATEGTTEERAFETSARLNQRLSGFEQAKEEQAMRGLLPTQMTRSNMPIREDQSYNEQDYFEGGRQISPTGVSEFYDRANAYNSTELEEERKKPLYKIPTTGSWISVDTLINDNFESYLNPNGLEDSDNTARLNNALLAMEIGLFSTAYDHHTLGFSNQDAATRERELNEADREAFEDTISPYKVVEGTPEIGADIDDIKAGLVDEGNSLDQYRHIYQFARAATNKAKRFLTGEKIDSEYDTEGKEYLLGEFFLKKAIEDGKLGIYSYTDARSGRKYYYVDLMNPDRDHIAYTAYDMAVALNPDMENIRLGSTVPTSSIASIAGSTQSTKRKDRVLTKDGKEVPIDEAVLSLMGGVGRVVDVNVLTLIDMLLQQIKTDLGREYFKLDAAKIAETRKNAYDREYAKLKRLGKFSEEEIEMAATSVADKQMQTVIAVTMQQIATDIGLLKGRIADTDLEGRQKIKYAEWLISEVNNRFQEISRDMQSDSKAIIRAADNFAEKAKIPVKNLSVKEEKERSSTQASLLNKILFSSPFKSKDGRKALDEWQLTISDFDRYEMNAKAMWAVTYIKLMSETGMSHKAHEYFDGASEPPNLKKMNPAEILKYYADNQPEIMQKLSEYGNEVDSWIKGKKLPEFAMDGVIAENGKEIKDWKAIVFSRGELGYYVTNLLDAKDYVNAKRNLVNNPDGTTYITLSGMQELDSNNSNIGIQALQAGNIKAAGTLGIAFNKDSHTIKDWYNKIKNPDSFYTILGNNYKGVVRELFGKDPDKHEAMQVFIDEAMKEASVKDLTRDIVVAGFYGLYPGVNNRSVEKLFTMVPNATAKLKASKAFSNQSELIKGMLEVQGLNFRNTLGQISVAADAKRLGALIAIIGDFDPHFPTETGALIKSTFGELTIAELSQIDHPEIFDRVVGRNEQLFYTDSKGRQQPVLTERQTIADSKENYGIDSEQNLVNITKQPGFRFADGIAAIYTHTLDAYLEKIALLAQNKNRQTAMPNVSIHDANKVNAIGYIDHWIAYNMIAIPQLLYTDPFLAIVADKTSKVYNKLQDVGNKAIAENKKGNNVTISIGTDKNNRFRALMHLFDREYGFIKDIEIETEQHKSKTLFDDTAFDPFNLNKNRKPAQKRSKSAKTPEHIFASDENKIKWLEEAAQLGWIPNDSDHPQYKKLFDPDDPGKVERMRKNQQISPENFKKLVDLAFKIYKFDQSSSEAKNKNQIALRIETMINELEKAREMHKKGHVVINTHNSG